MSPSVASVYYTTLIALIFSISEVMPSCSYYIKKGLVYSIIVSPSSRQPLSYTKYKKEYKLFNTCLLASSWLTHLKKVYKKIHLKQLCLAKQSIYKLKEEEAKALNTGVVIFPNPLVVPLLPLANPFLFNLSFSLLPNLISY